MQYYCGQCVTTTLAQKMSMRTAVSLSLKVVSPCSNIPPHPVPDFVGNDCDTGSEKCEEESQNIFHSEDPLWDGAGCGE